MANKANYRRAFYINDGGGTSIDKRLAAWYTNMETIGERITSLVVVICERLATRWIY